MTGATDGEFHPSPAILAFGPPRQPRGYGDDREPSSQLNVRDRFSRNGKRGIDSFGDQGLVAKTLVANPSPSATINESRELNLKRRIGDRLPYNVGWHAQRPSLLAQASLLKNGSAK